MQPSPTNAPTPEKILLVDDVAANLSVLISALEPQGYEILAVPSGALALKIAAKALPDLILLDVMMPDLDGFETCRRLKQEPATRNIPILFITARNDMDAVVGGFQAGGVDYIVKPFQPEEVVIRVATHLRLARLARDLLDRNRALELRTAELTAEMERRRQAESALQAADEQLSAISNLEADRWQLSGLIGESAAKQKIATDIRRLHQFPNTSVLITGECGTGKELIARALLFGSARARAPFVPVNCVAIPSELAESMLFGHAKGAFTGAMSDRKGWFEMAHGGTLFLDEIGDMPAALQVKLLRVLEDGCITPVGGTQPKKVDVRIIAATNADLAARIEGGGFRRDLYFRLARYELATTPLRERIDDVPSLAAHFLQVLSPELGLKTAALSAAAMAVLRAYDFPGNIRELKNIIERALIESGGRGIAPEHLHLLPRTTPATVTASARSTAAKTAAALPLNLAEAEDILIQRALQETGGNIADAARLLGVHRTRIYRKLAQDEPAATGG
jgi:DNA-binding NtrC family response regulator